MGKTQSRKNIVCNNRGSAGCAVVVVIFVIIVVIALIVSAFSPDEEPETTTVASTQERVIDLDVIEPESTLLEEHDTTTTKKPETTKQKKKQASFIYKEGSDFEITMLDVGQGLSLLIRADDKYIIYDGGGRSSSSYVVSYLKNHNINELSAIIVSHYDEDHFAGLIGVLEKYSVLNVICPAGDSDNTFYKSFIDRVDASGANVFHPLLGDRFSFGNAEILVLNPSSFESNDNNSSIAIRIKCGEFECVITGDAEEEAEQAMIDTGLELEAELLVVGHHGSDNSSSAQFIRAVKPHYAFISCGKDNPYGHPSQNTLTRLKNANVKIFRSDKQGDVTCYVDLNKGEYSFSINDYGNYNQEGITTTQPTTTRATTIAQQTTHVETYVVNVHTMKFHYPLCASVGQMSESNKRVVTCNRNDLISRGYEPCGRCCP